MFKDAPQQPGLLDSMSASNGQSAASEIETYAFDGRDVLRSVALRAAGSVSSRLPNLARSERDPHKAYDLSYLRSSCRPPIRGKRGTVRIVDLFCGAGGASLGIDEACRALDLAPFHIFAADINEDALETYRRNFSPEVASAEPIEERLDQPLGAPLSSSERSFRKQLGKVDLAFGGPPCQGHSNLNNYTRRADPKNSLYDRMARFAEVVQPTHLVIENVQGVRHDVGGVYDRTVARLREIGYKVVNAKLEANEFGVPQRRHRELVVASISPHIGESLFHELERNYWCQERSVGWAIADLLNIGTENPIDAITKVSKESQRRIDWMFDNDEFDLPDSMRPDCHRLNKHSYKSVYGRLYWDKPAWTITTGFQVMGQGRFLHPLERRVITSHEAARLQFIPDFFTFATDSRKGFAKMIGNAVPSKLAYVLALELLR